VNLKLVRIKELSGSEMTTYAIRDVVTEECSFQAFLAKDKFDPYKVDMYARIRSMANETGLIIDMFKDKEGAYGDGVVCLYDQPDGEMRLFCKPLTDKILIVGGGGPKPEHIQAWQQDPILRKAGNEMISVAAILNLKKDQGRIQFSEDGLLIVGDRYL
jgi:hypothetical protein